MQDEPRAAEILPAIATFLREMVTAAPSAHTLFQARVAANACDLAAREALLAPASDAAELDRLVALLGRTGTLTELNAELAARLSNGSMALETPELKAHLWATSMAKLAVDQPSYASYRRALKRLGS